MTCTGIHPDCLNGGPRCACANPRYHRIAINVGRAVGRSELLRKQAEFEAALDALVVEELRKYYEPKE